jgi:hypothetical protein
MSKVKQTMYCVYSPWGFHRCYQWKDAADKDAKRANNPRWGLMHHSVIECKVQLEPIYKTGEHD